MKIEFWSVGREEFRGRPAADIQSVTRPAGSQPGPRTRLERRLHPKSSSAHNNEAEDRGKGNRGMSEKAGKRRMNGYGKARKKLVFVNGAACWKRHFGGMSAKVNTRISLNCNVEANMKAWTAREARERAEFGVARQGRFAFERIF